MTALKPIENLRVLATASERYPLNKKCAHPECNEPAVDPHHIFPRSLIAGDSWFVIIADEETGSYEGVEPIPHVTGLCRAHHDEVEEHDAWIKLEDGVFVWYNHTPQRILFNDPVSVEWPCLGPLNPQPGSREGKPKRKRFKGEERRKRRVVSLRVPDDAGEDGAALLDEQVELLEAKINPDDDKRRPIYYTIMDALSFTNLNAGADDFGGDE